MIKKHTFVLQSELTQPIDKLLSHFRSVNLENKIDKRDIKYFQDFIGDADIRVVSELHYLKDFMNLEKVDMIHLDSLIERLNNDRNCIDPIIFYLSEEDRRDFFGKF